MSTNPDEYTGISINDIGETIPPGSHVMVQIATRDWEHFEEMALYLKEVELPLGPIQRLPGIGLFRSTDTTSSVVTRIVVITPIENDLSVIDPQRVRIEEVLSRVEAAA